MIESDRGIDLLRKYMNGCGFLSNSLSTHKAPSERAFGHPDGTSEPSPSQPRLLAKQPIIISLILTVYRVPLLLDCGSLVRFDDCFIHVLRTAQDTW